jgi:carbonic anhydrase/acetyltransferase-like protein (isoleucine patch superfamily)
MGKGCIVKNKLVIEDRKIAVGVPARIMGEALKDYQRLWMGYKNLYAKLALRYLETLEKACTHNNEGSCAWEVRNNV